MFTGEVFLNLVNRNIFPLHKVNLLIFDECHHAHDGHPMKQILIEYHRVLKREENRYNLPHILGLTAPVVHGRKASENVEESINKLEKAMDAVLVTSKDQNLVNSYSTKPEVVVKSFLQEDPENTLEIRKLLYYIWQVQDKGDEIKQLCESKQLLDPCLMFANTLKKINNYAINLQKLQDYIVVEAIFAKINHLNTCLPISVNGEGIKKLDEFKDSLTTKNKHFKDIKVAEKDYVLPTSPKIKMLIEFLESEIRDPKHAKVLIFVERRDTAKFLTSILLKFKKNNPKLAWIFPESLVGKSGTNSKQGLSAQKIEKQRNTLINFRGNACNIIVCTSVLEEGIDVPSSNCVIRFDKPSNFCSYIQSLGRARTKPSQFILLVAVEEENKLKNEVSNYKNTQNEIVKLCQNRCLPCEEDDTGSDDLLDLESPFEPFGNGNAKITFNNSISLVNKFCGLLPQDKFANLNFVTNFSPDPIGYKATICLPRNSLIKEPVTGFAYPNKRNAKKSAALKVCEILYERNELNKNLRPQKYKDDPKLLSVLNVPVETIKESSQQAVPKRRMQIYERKLCSPFTYKSVLTNSQAHRYYLHAIDFTINEPSQIGNKRLGLLLSNDVDICSFSLFYSDLSKKVNVSVSFLKIETILNKDLEAIEHFHKYIYKLFLKLESLDETKLFFNREKAGTSVLIVPLLQTQLSYKIDKELLMKTQQSNMPLLGSHQKSKNQHYANVVITPNYRKKEYYYVKEISSKTPLSPFPDIQYLNYKDYFFRKYGLDLKNVNENLLQCKYISKEVNKINRKEPRNHSENSDKSDKYPDFPPELCNSIPISTSLYFQIALIPSILHRLNGLLLAQELYHNVGWIASKSKEKRFSTEWLNFDLFKEDELKKLSYYLIHNSETSVDSRMFLQAITPKSANDNFNLERLEFIGDSFLKFIATLHLFFKETENHQGKLTVQRTRMICNKSLYALAKEKKIVSSIQGVKLEHHSATPYGFQFSEEIESQLYKKCINPRKWLSSIEVCSMLLYILKHINNRNF